jgi:hypothetical protein
MRDAQEGKIKFNRENDALTKALGNPEHGGRVRGKGAIPWSVGFSQDDDPYGYRSRKRKTDRDADFMGKLASELHEVKQMVYELAKERSAAAGPHEDLGSQQRRSSVASTEAPPGANAPLLAPAGATSAGANAPTIEIRAPEPHYPVDDVKEMKECDLHYPVGNISTKVATDSALPCTPGALHHNNPIENGYAHVMVEDIVQGFEDLEIDYATPEGEKTWRCQAPVYSMEKEVHSVSRRCAKANKSTPLRWRWWWWWWFTYTSFTSADTAPQSTTSGG